MESTLSTLDSHGHAFQELEVKLADMEDRNRRCNIRMVGLKEGLKDSNAIQYRSLPKWLWLLKLSDVQIEIMRAHRIYSDSPKMNTTTNRTWIFNVLRYTTRQVILQAAQKSPPMVRDRKICFSLDYSNFTVKQCQAFYQTMDSAKVKGLVLFLLYLSTLKIKEGSQYRAFTSTKDAKNYMNWAAPRPPVAVGMAGASDSNAENTVEED